MKNQPLFYSKDKYKKNKSVICCSFLDSLRVKALVTFGNLYSKPKYYVFQRVERWVNFVPELATSGYEYGYSNLTLTKWDRIFFSEVAFN